MDKRINVYNPKIEHSIICMKTWFVIYNIIFWASGIFMLCLGIMMRVELQHYISIDNINVPQETGTLLLGFAAMGGMIALAACLACCCTLSRHPALLYLYGAFIVLVVLLELGASVSIFAYRTNLIEIFDQNLNESISVYGREHSHINNHIDAMQSTLHCCGNHAYTDWFNIYPPKNIPLSCCKVPRNKCKTNDVDQIYIKGCYDGVVDFINKYVIETSAAIVFSFYPLIGIILSCWLANTINKTSDYEPLT